jgi:hypothetical protein
MDFEKMQKKWSMQEPQKQAILKNLLNFVLIQLGLGL